MSGRVPPGFVELDYLAANPDVARVVAAGQMPSGLVHYLHYGMHEGRALRPNVRAEPPKRPLRKGARPNRRDCILAGLRLARLEGVEIGALTAPLVTKQEGNVFYVDHADAETLKGSYRLHRDVDTANIVPVDGVWGENTLQDCLGPGRKVDYVVASHVIEHTPDLITWLREIHSVLRPRGTLRLAIPDKRYTFDIIRPETTVHDVVDAWLRRARIPLPRAILEHHSLIRQVDAQAIWDGRVDPAALDPYNTLQAAIEMARDALDNGAYHDVHCWVFTPASFAALCVELGKADLLGFACDYFIDTQQRTAEFFVSMTPCDDRTERVCSWLRAALELQRAAK